MTTNVIFHQLACRFDFGEPAFQLFACNFISDVFNQKNYISIVCQSVEVAEAIDEQLWQMPADRFIPHNLFGEGEAKASPVEIFSLQQLSTESRISNKGCLVNLSQHLPSSPLRFRLIHEFVPCDDQGKAEARQRYTEYKQAGCTLEFRQLQTASS